MGVRIPSVPPAASAPVASSPEYPWRFISGSATLAMVAPVAIEDPQTEPKAAHPKTVDMARPPRRCPANARAASKSERLSPARVANCPIRRKSGTTDKV